LRSSGKGWVEDNLLAGWDEMQDEHVLAVRLGCVLERWQDPARFLYPDRLGDFADYRAQGDSN